MLHWLPNAAASSARLYWEAGRERASAPPPSGPNPTVLHFHELDRGGHFAALEQPAAFADELRATFRSLRPRG